MDSNASWTRPRLPSLRSRPSGAFRYDPPNKYDWQHKDRVMVCYSKTRS